MAEPEHHEAEEGRQGQPTVRQCRRRDLLTLLGAAGAAAAVVAPYLASRPDPVRPPGASPQIPVRNPAFNEWPEPPAGKAILCCRTADGKTLAYELNPPALKVYRACAAHEQAQAGEGKAISAIASELAGQVEPRWVEPFVHELAGQGLVYFQDARSKIYFEYEKPF